MAGYYSYRRNKIVHKLSGFTIVLPLHIPLNHPSDYIYQTARILKKRNLIIVLDPYSTYSWQDVLFRNKLILFFQSVYKIVSDKKGLTYFQPLSVLPFKRILIVDHMNLLLGTMQLRIILWLKRNPVMLWGFHPIMERFVGKLGESHSLYDCVDYHGDTYSSQLRRQERSLMKKCTHCVFNSQELRNIKLQEYEDIFPLSQKSSVAVCGCDYALFSRKTSRPKEYRTIKRKIIVLAGHIDERIDFDLLRQVLHKHLDKTFIFIGPVSQTIIHKFNCLMTFPHIKYLGVIKKNDLPKYFQYADLGIIPYNMRQKSVTYCNPMKAYEYLASGIPVVSTRIIALEQYIHTIISINDDIASFNQAINDMIQAWSPEKVKGALEIVKQNSWKNKIQRIESIILKSYGKN